MASPHSMNTGSSAGSLRPERAARKYATWGSDGGAPTERAPWAPRSASACGPAQSTTTSACSVRPSAQSTATPSSDVVSAATLVPVRTSNMAVALSQRARRQASAASTPDSGSNSTLPGRSTWGKRDATSRGLRRSAGSP